MTEIQERLFALQDEDYRRFTAALIPTVPFENVIGVRLPAVRKLAAQLRREGMADAFLRELPHRYHEENLLHACLLSGEKDFDRCLEELERFLPCVDNWAVCDTLLPAAFAKHRAALREPVSAWLCAEHPYTVRFGIGVLMRQFLDEDFRPEHLETVASIRSEEYYVNMMIAWYFATALAKQYEAALPYLQEERLDAWTHRKTIQKAVESYRLPEDRKAYLKTLRVQKSKNRG